MNKIAEQVKPKIANVINMFPTECSVFRKELNEYNEPLDKVLLCHIKGFFHQGNNMISGIVKDSGEVKRGKQEYLMVVIDEETEQIKEGDLLTVKGIDYKISDLGNQNNMDIYYDMLLKRC